MNQIPPHPPYQSKRLRDFSGGEIFQNPMLSVPHDGIQGIEKPAPLSAQEDLNLTPVTAAQSTRDVLFSFHHHEHSAQCRLPHHGSITNLRYGDSIRHGEDGKDSPPHEIYPHVTQFDHQVLRQLVGQTHDEIGQKIIENRVIVTSPRRTILAFA